LEGKRVRDRLGLGRGNRNRNAGKLGEKSNQKGRDERGKKKRLKEDRREKGRKRKEVFTTNMSTRGERWAFQK